MLRARGQHRIVLLRQNGDELSFAKGDIIEVILFDSPDDDVSAMGGCACDNTGQEPGWLNGRLNDRKGVFPSNFTAPYNDGVQRF